MVQLLPDQQAARQKCKKARVSGALLSEAAFHIFFKCRAHMNCCCQHQSRSKTQYVCVCVHAAVQRLTENFVSAPVLSNTPAGMDVGQIQAQ